MENKYSWKRFWCARTDVYTSDSEGFTADPEQSYGALVNPSLRTFDELSDVPCLALLGEPGIGKSIAVEAEIANLKQRDSNAAVLSVDLRSVDSAQRLEKLIFDANDFKDWQKGAHHLHVFLDSFDECLLRFDALSQILVDGLKDCPLQRLSLRIVCRTAAWPAFLEIQLRQLWADDNFGAFELVPLRKCDVDLFARQETNSPDAFLEALAKSNAVPFAIKPVTLRFLGKVFAANTTLPVSQSELYDEGCRILCDYDNQSRLNSNISRKLSSSQRLAIAKRIAAVTLLAYKFAIYSGNDLGDLPSNRLALRFLCGSKETADGNEFEVTEVRIRETLDTGLFTSRGLDLFGWAHYTYAEFLAAQYIAERNVPTDQVLSFITHTAIGGGRIVPQLYGVTKWLATRDGETLKFVLQTGASILLECDPNVLDGACRSAISTYLLNAAEANNLSIREIPNATLLNKLNHSGISDQIRPFLIDASKSESSRCLAIEIAEACQLLDLQSELVEIALDVNSALYVRICAARAIYHYADSIYKAKLFPLANSLEEDSDDELKGYALLSLWPDHCSAAQLFAFLTYPRNTALYGAYYIFLSKPFVASLKVDDLPVALQWANQQQTHPLSYNPFGQAIAGILRLAWQHMNRTDIFDAFVTTATTNIQVYSPFFPDDSNDGHPTEWNDSDGQRRGLIHALVCSLVKDKQDVFCILHSKPPVLFIEDFEWLVQQAVDVEEENIRRAYARLVCLAFWPYDEQRLELVYEVTKDNENTILREAFGGILGPIALGSPLASHMEEQWTREREFKTQLEKAQQLRSPMPPERMITDLEAIEAGQTNRWITLDFNLQLELGNLHSTRSLSPTLSSMPGWKAADADARQRIVSAAERFVHEGDPETSQWLWTNTITPSAPAGYRALQLLLSENIAALEKLTDELWLKWLPVVIAMPIENFGNGRELYIQLLALAYRKVPERFSQFLIKMLDYENERFSNLSVLEAITFWDEKLLSDLLPKIQDASLKPVCLGQLLSTLLANCSDVNSEIRADVLAYAESRLNLYAVGGEARERAQIYAICLLQFAPNEVFPILWPLVEADTTFGRELFEALSYRHDNHSNNLQKLSEEWLAKLYGWLVTEYPTSEDPKYTTMEAHAIGEDESVRQFREEILQYLVRRGTIEACTQLEALMLDRPDLAYLSSMLRWAQTLTLHKTWEPLDPITILKIIQDSNLRLVRDGNDLIRVVQDSLKRLQQELQGETPSALFLWDASHSRNKTYRPKDENSFSDFVKQHLERDLKQRGIIANREVEIRSSRTSTQGERTDIQIDAVVKNNKASGLDVITLIVEVKGAWHKELLTAMESQLKQRYLRDNPCQYGLYLVGWYNCTQWEDSDAKKKAVPVESIQELKRNLDDQSKALSTNGVSIGYFVLDASLR